MITDTIAMALACLAGVCLLLVSSLVISMRRGASKRVAWKGFGVTFEITPCGACPNNTLGKE